MLEKLSPFRLFPFPLFPRGVSPPKSSSSPGRPPGTTMPPGWWRPSGSVCPGRSSSGSAARPWPPRGCGFSAPPRSWRWWASGSGGPPARRLAGPPKHRPGPENGAPRSGHPGGFPRLQFLGGPAGQILPGAGDVLHQPPGLGLAHLPGAHPGPPGGPPGGDLPL